VNRRLLPSVIVGTTVLTALLDLWTSAEFVGSILFVLPLALCAIYRSKKTLWATLLAAVVLTVLAEFWGFHRVPLVHPLAAFANRVILIVSLVTQATVIHFRITQLERQGLDSAEIARQRNEISAQNDQLQTLFALTT